MVMASIWLTLAEAEFRKLRSSAYGQPEAVGEAVC